MFRTSSVHPQKDCCKRSFCTVNSPAGGRVCSILINYAFTKLCNSIEHTLPAARLLTLMRINLPYENYVYKSLAEDKHMRFETCSKAIPLQAWTGPEGSRRLGHKKVVRLSALRTGRFYPFTHFC
jgi:hypothetical protein